MQDRFQHLYAVISGQRFLKKQGLGNEVPFFICPFKPEESVEMERLQRQLSKSLEQAGVRILEINLYDLQLLAQLSGKWAVDSGQPKEQKQIGVAEKTIHYPLVTTHSLKVPFSAAWLADETDVDRYLQSMREALLEEIRQGKRIQI